MKTLCKFGLMAITILLCIVTISSCKARTDSSIHNQNNMLCGVSNGQHNWDIKLKSGDKCAPGATALYTCAACGITKEVSADNCDYVVKETVLATCTKKGYSQYECKVCSTECVADFTNAIGHNYQNSNIIKEERCTNDGVYEQTCENCNSVRQYTKSATGHSYSPVVVDDRFKTYECQICYEKLTVETGESVVEFVGSEELFNVGTDFSFDITTNKDEDYIKQNLDRKSVV